MCSVYEKEGQKEMEEGREGGREKERERRIRIPLPSRVSTCVIVMLVA